MSCRTGFCQVCACPAALQGDIDPQGQKYLRDRKAAPDEAGREAVESGKGFREGLRRIIAVFVGQFYDRSAGGGQFRRSQREPPVADILHDRHAADQLEEGGQR